MKNKIRFSSVGDFAATNALNRKLKEFLRRKSYFHVDKTVLCFKNEKMKFFIAKILIFVLYSGSIQSQDSLNCGTAKRNSGFIVHGDQFKRGDFPWIVALLYTGFSPPSYFCGGSLISSRHVVTGKIFHFFINNKPQIIFSSRTLHQTKI